MILTMVARLDRSALASSTSSAIGGAFDAATSSIQKDLSRLISTSYVATRNILLDSTKFNLEGYNDIKNIIFNYSTGTVRPRADEFVISSADIMTLSVRVLIIVPAVLFLGLVLLGILSILPERWRLTDSITATKMHKKMQQHDKQDNGAAKYVPFPLSVG
jgi:hypothetical protein